jgi:HlyD family secretion protein
LIASSWTSGRARPDWSVEGTIETESLKDVIYVGRPAFGQPNSTVGIFKLDEEDNGEARVQVKLGRSSVNTAERLCPIEGGGLPSATEKPPAAG